MEPPAHHAKRLNAVAVVLRLHAVKTAVGSYQGLYDLVGGQEHFEELVAKRRQLENYFGVQQSLPREETHLRIRTFVEAVEPAIAAGTRPDPASLRAVLRGAIDARAARRAAATRRYR